ncbi:MAG: ABC transporter substrate-binding protein, partial [Butyricicoccus sp.]|nr:ABC transporter substrate-binding protein [Butyricicoccus sp.]
MRFTKLLALALAALTCLGLMAGCSGAVNYAENNTEIVIGVSGPLTGGAAMYGVAVKNAAQLAVDEINANGGLNGMKFKLVATDDANDATKVGTNFASMLEGGMQLSLG